MRRVFQLLVCLLISSFFLHAFSSFAFAAGEFSPALKSRYIVSDDTTHVFQEFKLTNNFSTMYVTEYALEVGSNRITNVKVTTTGGPVDIKTTPHGNKTTISLTFSDKVIGKDQVREFTVSYDTPDISIRTGNILEVNIPKLANAKEFTSYIVEINVPSQFGSPALVFPKNSTISAAENKTIVTFSSTGQNGISVLFGKEQLAQFALSYHVENPTNNRGTVTIALPPDSTFQRIYFSSIDPPPREIHEDQDGNWLATYLLEPGQKETIKAVGTAVITLEPQPHAKLLTKRPGREYLAETNFWQSNNPEIQKLAKQLKTPKAIYDYVVKTLTYDYQRLDSNNKRLGALGTIKNPASAVCTEFTDLFIALARAADIPAREVNGFAYTQNDTLRPLSLLRDVLHAWPEYWDEATSHWVALDPTWENTTGGVDYFSHLDFNHVVFAIHGINSETPYPAGVYKLSGEETKDIAVSFGHEKPTVSELVGAGVVLKPSLLPEAQSLYNIRFANNALHAVYGMPYSVHVLKNGQEIMSLTDTISLLPLSGKDIPLNIPASSLFSTQTVLVETQINNQVFTDQINVKSFVNSHAQFLAIASILAGAGLIIAVLIWRLLVPRHKRRGTVRRKS